MWVSMQKAQGGAHVKHVKKTLAERWCQQKLPLTPSVMLWYHMISRFRIPSFHQRLIAIVSRYYHSIEFWQVDGLPDARFGCLSRPVSQSYINIAAKDGVAHQYHQCSAADMICCLRVAFQTWNSWHWQFPHIHQYPIFNVVLYKWLPIQ